MSTIVLKVNGAAHRVDVDPSTPLLYVLRNDLGLRGPHTTVVVDNAPAFRGAIKKVLHLVTVEEIHG